MSSHWNWPYYPCGPIHRPYAYLGPLELKYHKYYFLFLCVLTEVKEALGCDKVIEYYVESRTIIYMYYPWPLIGIFRPIRTGYMQLGFCDNRIINRSIGGISSLTHTKWPTKRIRWEELEYHTIGSTLKVAQWSIFHIQLLPALVYYDDLILRWDRQIHLHQRGSDPRTPLGNDSIRPLDTTYNELAPSRKPKSYPTMVHL